jgi:ketosteroid isomerase-like protein
MQIHSKDLVRASRDSNAILNYEQYKEQNKKNNQFERGKKFIRTIELRFLERTASTDQAYEVGIYKTTVTDDKGSTSSFYGKFHVALRKENNIWKILVDSDSSEGDTISEKQFLEAKSL